MSAEWDLDEQLKAAEQRINEHPGHKEYLELQALERSILGVFVPNLQELVQLLDAAATDEELAFELIQNVREPVVRDQFHARVTQRLHNYLASAQSLVDHVRRLMRGREGLVVDEFERRKDEVLATPEVPFMVSLRNYTLHRTLPLFAHTLSMANVNTPDQRMMSEVELSVADLLAWNGWRAPARRFLEAEGDRVQLRPIVKKHGELILQLNTWLHHELAKANEPALDEVNELIVDRNAVLTGGYREATERAAAIAEVDEEVRLQFPELPR